MKRLLDYQITFLSFSFTPRAIIQNPLFSGSAFMVIGTNLANFFAYLYHVVFGRLFIPEQYGELAATLSLITMVSSAVAFFSVVVVKFISASDTHKEKQKLLSWFVSKGILIGSIVCTLFILATPSISTFLHVNWQLIVLIGPILLFSLLSLIVKSFLQGILKFKETVIIANVEMIGRLVFGFLFVTLGFAVFGAFVGMFVTSFFTLFLGWYFLKRSEFNLFGLKQKQIDSKKVFSYAIPILLSSIASNALLSMDLVLVKHFFNAENAGIYAASATLGKIIFFGTFPVSMVMFPLVSQKHAKGESYGTIFLASLGMTLLVSLGVLFIFWLIPDLVIQTIYNKGYLDAEQNLVWYGIFITCFTLATLILNFYLSIGRTKLIIFCVMAALIQIGGIWIWHSSLMQVIQVSIVSSVFFLLSLLAYFIVDSRILDYRKINS